MRTLRDRWGGESANCLDWALEVAGGLELQLVGHRMDLETVEPGPGQRSKRQWGEPHAALSAACIPTSSSSTSLISA